MQKSSLWYLEGGTSEQQQVIALVMQDLSKMTGDAHLCTTLSEHHRIRRRICVGDWAFDTGADDDAHGLYYEPSPRLHTVCLRPYLQGAQLYVVMAHELGHWYGLGHTKAGLMAVVTLQQNRTGTKWPTLRQRQRIMRQLMISIAKYSVKHLDEAA